MKKVIIYLITGIALISCTGFLDEKRTTSFTDDQIYDSEQALEANIYGCYLTLHNTALWKGTMSEYIHTASGLLIWGKERLTDEWLSGMYFTRYSNSIGGNESIWNLSVYNVYCRMNPFFAFVTTGEDGKFKGTSIGIIPIIPSISYTLRF